jgi:hypothetical protein
MLEEFSVQISAVTRLNIACKWWGRIRQKYDLCSIVIFTLVQLIIVTGLLTEIFCDGASLLCFKARLTCPSAIHVANG